MNHHDAPTARWFRYNSACSACFIGHSHTHAAHCAALATARATEMVWAATEWRARGYWDRMEEIERLARALTPAVTAETPLVDGAWE